MEKEREGVLIVVALVVVVVVVGQELSLLDIRLVCLYGSLRHSYMCT